MTAYSGSSESARAEKNNSFFSKLSSKITTFWADLTSDGSEDVNAVMEADEFLEDEEFLEAYAEEPVKTAPRAAGSRYTGKNNSYSAKKFEEPQSDYIAEKSGVYGKSQEDVPELRDEDINMSSDEEDDVEFEITPRGLSSSIQFTGTYHSSERVASGATSAIGFDLPRNSAGTTPPAGTQAGTASPVGFNGKSAPSNHSAAVIQFFEPHETKQADEICSVLKAGAIVIVNLQNVKEESDKLRIIDFVAGCCKGIDAKVQMVATKSIFVAAPKGIELRKPVIPTEAGDAAGENGTGNSAIFSGFNFGVPGSERSTNSFIPKF